MKKFKFSLQSLHNYKKTVEKIQLGELRRAQQALRELMNEKQRLLDAFAQNERSLAEALRKKENVGVALTEHDIFFKFLRDALAEVEIKIIKAEEVRDACRDRLVITMREIKTLLKLKDEQYQVWLKEAQAETDREIDDLVSFNTVNEAAGAQ